MVTDAMAVSGNLTYTFFFLKDMVSYHVIWPGLGQTFMLEKQECQQNLFATYVYLKASK